MARATAMVLAVTTRPIRANGQAILSPSGPESARHVATYVQVVPILCGLLRWQRISPLVRNQPQLGGHDVRQPALISLNDWPRFQSYPHINPHWTAALSHRSPARTSLVGKCCVLLSR